MHKLQVKAPALRIIEALTVRIARLEGAHAMGIGIECMAFDAANSLSEMG